MFNRSKRGGVFPLEVVMEQFVREQNLLHFQKLLLRVTDQGQRELIIRLIVEEEAKGIPPNQSHQSNRKEAAALAVRECSNSPWPASQPGQHSLRLLEQIKNTLASR
jgi:hypothetical protein